MRILRTTERHGAGWREQNFIPDNTITWLLYGVYFLVIVVLLIAPKMKK